MSTDPLDPPWTPDRVREWSRHRAASLLLQLLDGGGIGKAEATWRVQDASPAEQRQLLLDALDVLDQATTGDETTPLRIRLLDLRDLYGVGAWPWTAQRDRFLVSSDLRGHTPAPPPELRLENGSQQ